MQKSFSRHNNTKRLLRYKIITFRDFPTECGFFIFGIEKCKILLLVCVQKEKEVLSDEQED